MAARRGRVLDLDAKLSRDPRRNIFGTIRAEPSQERSPDSFVAVKAAVQSAESNRARVRAVGSAWSSTDVFVSDEVWMKSDRNTALAVIGPGLDPAAPIPSDRSDPAASSPPSFLHNVQWLANAISRPRRQEYFAYMGAGLSIHRLYRALDRVHPPLTIPVMGSSSGQTVPGVISTGTHGGDITNAPIADGVRAIRLVVPGAKEHWIEPAGDAALTTPGYLDRIKRTIGLDAVHQDDELFYSAVTSVGCIGVITAVVLQVVPQFGLSEVKSPILPWSWVEATLRDGSLFSLSGLRGLLRRAGADVLPESEELVDLELLLNPYLFPPRRASTRSDSTPFFDPSGRSPMHPAREQADREVIVVARTRSSRSRILSGPAERPAPGLFSQLGIPVSITDLELARSLVTDLMGSTRGTTTGFFRAAFLRDTFSGPDLNSPGVTSEICITTAEGRHLELIGDLLRSFDGLVTRSADSIFTGFFSIRFQNPSKALISMQHSRPEAFRPARICHIEVQALLDLGQLGSFVAHNVHSGDLQGRNDDFMLRFERVARSHGARLHWGQLNLLGRQAVESNYADTLYRWRRARTRLSRDGNGRTFSSDFSERAGLESYSEIVAVSRTGPQEWGLFGFREDGGIVHLQWNGRDPPQGQGIENPFASLDDQFTGPLTSVSSDTGHIQLFGVGESGHLLMYERRDGAWSAVDLGERESIDFPVNSPISACLWPEETPKTFIFGLDSDGHVIQAHNRDGTWAVAPLAGHFARRRFYGRVVATSWEPNRIDLFGRDRGGDVVHSWNDGSDEWQEGAVVAGTDLATPIAAGNRGPGRLDLFGFDSTGRLIRIRNDREGDPRGWMLSHHPPSSLLGASLRRMSLAQSRVTGLDDPHYQHIRRRLPNSFFGELCAASSTDPNRVDVFGLGRRSETGTQRSWYHAAFIDDRVEWRRYDAPFWGD